MPLSVSVAKLLASPRLHLALGVISFLLLLFLAVNFARGAWRAYRAGDPNVGEPLEPRLARQSSLSRGYLLGLILALTSPWNVGFWFADPADDDVCFGAGQGPVTPFDGDDEAGVQVMNSANALPNAPLP